MTIAFRPAAAAASLVLLLSLGSAARIHGFGVQNDQPAVPGTLRLFFTARSAKVDNTLGDEVRKEFEDDDGSPLKSVSIDLKGDGKEEKLVLCAKPSASHGSQWLVWDPAMKSSYGVLIGTIIFVGRDADQSFPRLETYWKQSSDMAVVFNYVFTKGKYSRVRARSLTLPEINEYFRTKPPLDLDKELVEIKERP